jgi:hypothetical protein
MLAKDHHLISCDKAWWVRLKLNASFFNNNLIRHAQQFSEKSNIYAIIHTTNMDALELGISELQQAALEYGGNSPEGLQNTNRFIVDPRLGDDDLWREVILSHPWILPLRPAPTTDGQAFEQHTIQPLQSAVQGEVMPVAMEVHDVLYPRVVVREDLFLEPKVLYENSQSDQFPPDRKTLFLNACEVLLDAVTTPLLPQT